MNILFTKMHGLGNDFVVINGIESPVALSVEQRKHIADRRYGVGCDQILLLAEPQTNDTDFYLHLYNADGSVIEACGNGTRCAARLWMDKHGKDACRIQTLGGILDCERAGDESVQVDMGEPRLDWKEIPLAQEQDTLSLSFPGKTDIQGVAVSMGNPHCVFFVDNVDDVDLYALGPALETDSMFPQKANIEFAQIMAPDKIRMRVWERGVGVTQACGSGACATLVAAVRRNLSGRAAEIILDGGNLAIVWDADTNRVQMTGPATYSFEGNIL